VQILDASAYSEDAELLHLATISVSGRCTVPEVSYFRGSAKLEIIHKGMSKGKTFLKLADTVTKAT
jgi:hydroxymethylpyrimidine pyrophosphatase-like HAD family hydrolase